MFSKKATKFDEIFTFIWSYEVNVKSTVKISSIFAAFLENMNFTSYVCITYIHKSRVNARSSQQPKYLDNLCIKFR
jgi:hypothetical protein